MTRCIFCNREDAKTLKLQHGEISLCVDCFMACCKDFGMVCFIYMLEEDDT